MTERVPLISLRGVTVKFRVAGRKRLTAVDQIDMEVYQGDTVGLIGESGSGKSTVARAIVGLSPIASGELFWRGRSVKSFDRRERHEHTERVQMVFQDPHSALDPRRTILQSVREPLDVLHRGAKDKRADLAMKVLSDVGLAEHHASRYPHQLSGGQKQRANIARALITRPEVLICDESVAALDVALQAEILNLLEDLKAEYDLTIVFISHDLSVVGHVANRIHVMYLGKIVERAPATAFFAQQLHPYSKALLSAQPRVDPKLRTDRVILTGDIPSPLSPPPGCRFQTRCSFAIESCRSGEILLEEIESDREVACIRARELARGSGVEAR